MFFCLLEYLKEGTSKESVICIHCVSIIYSSRVQIGLNITCYKGGQSLCSRELCNFFQEPWGFPLRKQWLTRWGESQNGRKSPAPLLEAGNSTSIKAFQSKSVVLRWGPLSCALFAKQTTTITNCPARGKSTWLPSCFPWKRPLAALMWREAPVAPSFPVQSKGA